MTNITNTRKKLMAGNVKFKIKGHVDYMGEDHIYKVTIDGGAIYSEYNGMNIKKWGPTCVTLYSFDMLKNKTTGKIKYSNIILCQ